MGLGRPNYVSIVSDVADFTPLERVAEVKPPRQPRMIPPYNGFGSEEDSLGNCLSLIPKPPQRDFVKFMAHDRRGLDSNELRFTARLVTDVAVDRDRRFIVSYYRTDDTLLIFEPPVRNSGTLHCFSCDPASAGKTKAGMVHSVADERGVCR